MKKLLLGLLVAVSAISFNLPEAKTAPTLTQKDLTIVQRVLDGKSFQIEAERRGCCSWHGGVSYCGYGGKIVCRDGTYSPSCRC